MAEHEFNRFLNAIVSEACKDAGVPPALLYEAFDESYSVAALSPEGVEFRKGMVGFKGKETIK